MEKDGNDPCLMPVTGVDSHCVEDKNVKDRMISLTEKCIRKCLCELSGVRETAPERKL